MSGWCGAVAAKPCHAPCRNCITAERVASVWHRFVDIWRRLIAEDSFAKTIDMLVMFSVVVQRSRGRVNEMQAGER